jgi:sugar lactone lactonase YvrE
MSPERVELVLDAKARLGEGAVWDAGPRLLYWVDIEGHEVHVFDPAAGRDRSFALGDYVGTVVPRARGGLALALGRTFAALDLETRKVSVIAEPEAEKPRHGNRFNDGKCDPRGRFWAGTMSISEGPGAGGLYRLDADHRVHRMLEGVSISNGIVWNADADLMYYIDTPTREVAVFDYDDATGAISNRRVAVRFPAPHGWPDGMAIDAEGMLWIAEWDGGCVTRWDPESGKLLRRIVLPVRRVTSCAFGGPDLDELYVTTAWSRLDDAARRAQPTAGGLFRLDPGVRGTPTFAFAG